MPYSLQSPDEQQQMTDFTAHLPAIRAFKARYPKESWEGAYFKVTGREFLPGRSVKISGRGVPEMTKDRTVKSVLAKYVAPIGAGALTALTFGGAAPTLGSLFGMGGSAAASVGAPAALSGQILGTGAAAAGNAAAWGGTAAAGAGSLWKNLFNPHLINAGVNAATNIYGTKAQLSANDRATEAQEKAAAEELAFRREVEAQRQREFETTRRANYDQWAAEAGNIDAQRVAREGRLTPYRGLGQTAASQLSRGMGWGPVSMADLTVPNATIPPYVMRQLTGKGV